jgi:hypothetical protein
MLKKLQAQNQRRWAFYGVKLLKNSQMFVKKHILFVCTYLFTAFTQEKAPPFYRRGKPGQNSGIEKGMKRGGDV